MDPDIITKFDEMIWSVSKRASNDFPDTDPFDIATYLWDLISERADDVQPDHPGLKSFLWKQARGEAGRQRKENLKTSAQYSYRVSDVKLILETVFDPTEWRTGFTPSDAKMGERDGMAPIEVRLDVLRGYKGLDYDQRCAIVARYRHPMLVPERGSKTEKYINRAVRELTARINEYKGL